MKRSKFIKSLIGIAAIPFVAVKLLEETNPVDTDKVTVKTPEGEMWFSMQEVEAEKAWQESYLKMVNESSPLEHQLLKKHGNKKLSELRIGKF
jgi:hypothetical protein